MAALRELLTEAGFADVSTYVQSGNVVLTSDAKPLQLETKAERLLADRFGFEVPVIVRSAAELADLVKRNPLAGVADQPKRYQVTFLAEPLAGQRVRDLAALAAGAEQLVAEGRELYAWHPEGIGRSKLAAALAAPQGVKATARNWATVTKLLEMANG